MSKMSLGVAKINKIKDIVDQFRYVTTSYPYYISWSRFDICDSTVVMVNIPTDAIQDQDYKFSAYPYCNGIGMFLECTRKKVYFILHSNEYIVDSSGRRNRYTPVASDRAISSVVHTIKGMINCMKEPTRTVNVISLFPNNNPAFDPLRKLETIHARYRYFTMDKGMWFDLGTDLVRLKVDDNMGESEPDKYLSITGKDGKTLIKFSAERKERSFPDMNENPYQFPHPMIQNTSFVKWVKEHYVPMD